MKNLLKPPKVLELEQYISEHKKICTLLLLSVQEDIRLGRLNWGNLFQVMEITLFTFKDKTMGFSREFRLPYKVMLTYAKERKELPLHLKLWT